MRALSSRASLNRECVWTARVHASSPVTHWTTIAKRTQVQQSRRMSPWSGEAAAGQESARDKFRHARSASYQGTKKMLSAERSDHRRVDDETAARNQQQQRS